MDNLKNIEEKEDGHTRNGNSHKGCGVGFDVFNWPRHNRGRRLTAMLQFEEFIQSV